MSKFTKSATFVIAITSLALFVFPVSAQLGKIQSGDCSQLGIKCTGGENSATFVQTLTTIINSLLVVVGVVAAIYLVLGGVRYVMSQGDSGEAEKAKLTILYAVIGLIIIGLSAVIVNFIIYIVGSNGGGTGVGP